MITATAFVATRRDLLARANDAVAALVQRGTRAHFINRSASARGANVYYVSCDLARASERTNHIFAISLGNCADGTVSDQHTRNGAAPYGCLEQRRNMLIVFVSFRCRWRAACTRHAPRS